MQSCQNSNPFRSRTDNVVCSLIKREFDCKAVYRRDRNIARRISLQDDVSYTCVWKSRDNIKSIDYESDRLYIGNYTKCMYLHGKNDEPALDYSFPDTIRRGQIDECLSCDGPLEHLPMENKGYRPCLFFLVKNYLYRCDLASGAILEKFYMSKKYNFRHMSWADDSRQIVIKSTKLNGKENRGHSVSTVEPTELPGAMMLIMMYVFPVEFVVMVKIKKEVFGNNISDVTISTGTLIVCSCPVDVCLYNFDEIIQKNMTAKFTIGDVHNGDVVGTAPLGMPENVFINERPPILYQIRCSEHLVLIGGYPWHCMFTPTDDISIVKVQNIQTKVDTGCFDVDLSRFHPDRFFYHVDDSGRIVRQKQDKVRVWKIVECDPVNDQQSYDMRVDFDIKVGHDQPEPVETKTDAITLSGRIVRNFFRHLSACFQYEKRIQLVDYDYDLDCIVVAYSEHMDEGLIGFVALYHNDTGKLLKEIRLKGEWEEHADHSISIELDTLVHIFKVYVGRKYNVFVYKAQRLREGVRQF